MYLGDAKLTTEEITRELEYATGLRRRPSSRLLLVGAGLGLAFWFMTKKGRR